jgi:hypothetical protein
MISASGDTKATHTWSFFSIVAFLFAALSLASCAGYAPTDRMLGNTREQVIEILGRPTNDLETPEGTLMIYPRGPFGKHTYFAYFDQDGRATRFEQVLNDKNFDRIKPGMHRDEVVGIVGEARDRFGLARERGYVWNYRYVTPHCFWFQIEFSRDNIVRETGYSKPPECRGRGR